MKSCISKLTKGLERLDTASVIYQCVSHLSLCQSSITASVIYHCVEVNLLPSPNEELYLKTNKGAREARHCVSHLIMSVIYHCVEVNLLPLPNEELYLKTNNGAGLDTASVIYYCISHLSLCQSSITVLR